MRATSLLANLSVIATTRSSRQRLAGAFTLLLAVFAGCGPSAGPDAASPSVSHARWRDLHAAETFSSVRGFELTGRDGWTIHEPDGTEIVSVISTRAASWENGADDTVPLIYISLDDAPASAGLRDIVELYWPTSWSDGGAADRESLTATFAPNEASTWGGSITVVRADSGVWTVVALIPNGPDYEAMVDDATAMVESLRFPE